MFVTHVYLDGGVGIARLNSMAHRTRFLTRGVLAPRFFLNLFLRTISLSLLTSSYFTPFYYWHADLSIRIIMLLRSGSEKKTPETYVPRKTKGDNSNKRQKANNKPPKIEDGVYTVAMPTSDRKLLQDAREAAPALFAKPGDKFEWTGWTGDSSVVEYVGRNMVPSKAVEFRGETTGEYKSPKKGWLIFKNSGGYTPLNVSSGGIRDACGARPLACHHQYDEEGEVVDEGTMVLPPEKVGVLNKCQYDRDEEGEGKNDMEPEEEIVVSKKLLQEAKRAVPVLFAKPGDKFEWTSCHPSCEVEPCVMTYLGRNALLPKKVSTCSYSREYSPDIGWSVFANLHSGKYNNHIDICNDGIRDGISAWPMSAYSHYNYDDLKEATTLFELALWKAKIGQANDTAVDREACRIEVPGPVKDTLFGYLDGGARYTGTLCIPPEKCGPIKIYKEPRYDDYW